MSEPKLTDWFAADVKPAIPGWYEREYEKLWIRKWYDKWDGERWLLGNGSGETIGLAGNRLRWRGLAESASNENGQRGSEA
jgi:hypothetical protein